ncbi:uncharacterized protein TNCV_491611 [Trichonephila clavipes]|nr:uncharacterized protein TNCV_491611 [Trichonephila clavipes]
MASCNHMCCHSCNGSNESFFKSTMLGKGVTRLSLHCYNHSLVCPIPRFVSNPGYLGSFGTVSWASHEFKRTRGRVKANMERNVSRHHRELACLNARLYRILHSR